MREFEIFSAIQIYIETKVIYLQACSQPALRSNYVPIFILSIYPIVPQKQDDDDDASRHVIRQRRR